MKHVIWAVLFALGCSGTEAGPEERIREVLAAVEHAAEVGDVSEIKRHVAEAYADDRGNDRRAIVRYVQFHLLRNERRHLLTRIASLEVAGPAQAHAVVHAGLLGRPAENLEELSAMRADLYTFDFDFVLESGAWRVARADWKRAAPTDLF